MEQLERTEQTVISTSAFRNERGKLIVTREETINIEALLRTKRRLEDRVSRYEGLIEETQREIQKIDHTLGEAVSCGIEIECAQSKVNNELEFVREEERSSEE